MGIVEVMSLPNLRGSLRQMFEDRLPRILDRPEMMRMLELCSALWAYDPEFEPRMPHPILRSGAHSDFFVNCMDALKESTVLNALAHQIVIRCSDMVCQMTEDDWVIGAERAGAPISQEVARLVGCRHATVEKDSDGNPTVFNRFDITAREKVLLVNDLLSHPDGSTYMSKVAVQQACPEAEILPAAMHVVNRSNAERLIDDTPVRALLPLSPREYPADNCPLCQEGSEALKFKANKALFYAYLRS